MPVFRATHPFYVFDYPHTGPAAGRLTFAFTIKGNNTSETCDAISCYNLSVKINLLIGSWAATVTN